MELPANNPAHFPARWAFVVQFQSDTAGEQGHLAGQVEHVVLGQVADFQSLETLMAFIAQVLRAEREGATGPQANGLAGAGGEAAVPIDRVMPPRRGPRSAITPHVSTPQSRLWAVRRQHARISRPIRR
jgi:hypothetical protein